MKCSAKRFQVPIMVLLDNAQFKQFLDDLTFSGYEQPEYGYVKEHCDYEPKEECRDVNNC